MNDLKAVFRFDANPALGAGHAMRCLVLANYMQEQGWQCYFATAQEAYDFVPALKAYSRINPDSFLKEPMQSALLIVDHYDLDEKYEGAFRDVADNIFVIDDLANRKHDCDFLLDQTYGRKEEHYESLVPADCTILTGPAYALLRPVFSEMRDDAIRRRENIRSIERVLLNFGGCDQKNMTLESLRKLQATGYSGKIDIVLGFHAPHRDAVEEFADIMMNSVEFHAPDTLPQLMLETDFAIGTPSVTTWERACLGLPSLLLLTAEIQSFCLSQLKQDGLIVGDSLDGIDDAGMFPAFDAAIYAQYVDKNLNMSDGMGVSRVYQKIEEKVNSHELFQEAAGA